MLPADFENDINIAKFLVLDAPHILSQTPCSLRLVARRLADNGACDTVEKAIEGILSLRDRFPCSIVVEREGRMGNFLVFYHVQPLARISGINTRVRDVSLASASDSLACSTSLELLFNEIRVLTNMPTALAKQRVDRIRQDFPEAPLTLICPSQSRATCLEEGRLSCLNKIHFERILHPHTDASQGDCSYLDTCFKWRQCKFVHYRVIYPESFVRTDSKPPGVEPPQFINANLLQLDMNSLGSDYGAMIIDPPWEIHTNPGQTNACTDDKVLGLNIGALQTSGIAFLWVTGRVLDFGRQCLTRWGYSHIEELIWLKTNQLGRTICTGRTGHWLNHTKEHVLVGVKGDMDMNLFKFLYTDVLVSSALGRSQKPGELYGIIDRIVGPKTKKIELFGRKSNVRAGWLTIGNEMGATRLHDPWLKKQLKLI